MREAIPCLLGEHDFSSFQPAGCDAEHAVRKVYRASLEQRGELLVYTIEATAFLRTAESFMNYWKRATGPKRARPRRLS
jgi:tRNA pseudouridine(38-40) synthase